MMSTTRPLVSVMVPVRNGADTIGAALHSVLVDGGNVEVVVVNDGSTDSTRDVVLSFDDQRIVLIDQPGLGVNAARNMALEQMSGEWVAMLDADDEWLPGRLEALWSCIDASAGPLVADDMLIERRGSRPYSLLAAKGLHHHTGAISAAEFTRLDLGLLHPTVRADLVEDLRFPAHVQKTGDFPFWFRAVKRAGGLRLCRSLGYRHRRNPNSVSAQSPALWMQSIAATAELLSMPGLDLTDSEASALDERLRIAWGRYQRGLAMREWQAGRRAAAVGRMLARPSIALERAHSAQDRARVSWKIRGSRRPTTDLDLLPPAYSA
jgi:hypothetical protein